jgi:hypothetical protein
VYLASKTPANKVSDTDSEEPGEDVGGEEGILERPTVLADTRERRRQHGIAWPVGEIA